jgi:hypothetical protein
MIKILSLGAGVQSTAVLLMSLYGDLERIDHAIFADTGWEPAAVYRNLEWLKEIARNNDINLEVVSCGRNIRDDEESATMRGLKSLGQRFVSMPFYTMSEHGKKGMVRRQCTREYKIAPIVKRIREIASPPRRSKDNTEPVVEQWMGISYDEASRMRVAKEWWISNRYPLIEKQMTRFDCLRWMDDHGYPTPPRSACIVCPFKHNDEWRHMRETSPDEWEDACLFDESIRDNGGGYGQLFAHRDCIPLREVDLRTLEDHGQTRMWDNYDGECAGMCGI